jgi:glycosyltransferase involved in cell wall biosynthesis
LPLIFSQADLLLIANDFDKEGIDYLRYSMPTKVSEYMISGAPILVYASAETAVSQFFIENDCGSCVTEQDQGKLNDAIKMLVENKDYRQKISTNAVKIALELFDAENVKNVFQQLIINLVK